ncbi:hypothetical protein Leryth_023838, partial [Lithospermum erythrorhizon]
SLSCWELDKVLTIKISRVLKDSVGFCGLEVDEGRRVIEELFSVFVFVSCELTIRKLG